MENAEEKIFFEGYGVRILVALRRIMRAVDIYSRRLNIEFKITAPQFICLYSLEREDGITLSALASRVNIGISTVNGIVDRLEEKGLLTRTRSETDRRRVKLCITREGREVAKSAPDLLQKRLVDSLKGLPELEQATIALSLERVVELMEAAHLDKYPHMVSETGMGEEIQNEKVRL